ncbi:MAG: TraB/GumN family protein [Bacteroidota bacterium]
MLLKKCLYSFVSLVLLLPSFTKAQKKPVSSLLWKISGKGLNQPSYLFGTFHIMCKSDFTISPALEEKIKTTKQFYGELDMDDPGMQMNLMIKMRLQETSLNKLLGETDYKAVSDSFKNITGMPLQLFDQFSPFMPMSLLAISSIKCADKVQPETEFVNIAKKNHLPVLGLESIEDQINAINAQPLDSQVLALKNTVLKYDSVQQMMVKMIKVYKQNNTEKLYRFIMNNGGTTDFETAMLITRNKNWIPVIKKAVGDKPSFFAVGAGHLGGKQGIIALLKKEGYTLTPLLY